MVSSDYAYAIPGKLYEHIAHARPVLGALPQGSAQRLIEGEGFGLVADPRSPETVAEKLVTMLDFKVRERMHLNLMRERHKYEAEPHFLALGRRLLDL